MSYDYMVMRLRVPARRPREVDGRIVHTEDWTGEASAILRSESPDLRWREEGDVLLGDGSHLGLGELGIMLWRRPVTSAATVTWLSVNGSRRADQRALVARLAAAVRATAFDCQTGEAL